MQRTEKAHMAKNAQRQVRTSTTLNRRYVKKPTAGTDVTVTIKKSPKVQRFNTPQTPAKKKVTINEQPMEPAMAHPMQRTAHTRMQARQAQKQPQVSRMTAQQLKEQAIKKALASASATPAPASTLVKESTRNASQKKATGKIKFGVGRVMLALSCAAAAVFAIAYFVNLNMPDISLRVAAMQTGIDAKYPGYVPNGFTISGITSENGKITLNFRSSSDDRSFTLTEEKSVWDSSSLLTNYVKEAFSGEYSTIREQGITLYTTKGKATWVNGGILYKLDFDKSTLTDKQIRSIAVSL